jgi:hypothetical protein
MKVTVICERVDLGDITRRFRTVHHEKTKSFLKAIEKVVKTTACNIIKLEAMRGE